MDGIDWNARATWDKAAEHPSTGFDTSEIGSPAERREGPLGELVRDYFAAPEDSRVAIRIVQANGLPLDDAELRRLAQQPGYPFAD